MDHFMNLSKPFLAGAVLSFLGLLLLTEIFLRLTVPTGFWYKQFDVSGDMTSLAELQDRLQFAAPQEHRVLLLGDSVLGASALMEHDLPRAKTLSCFLSGELQKKGYNALSLGSDGLLLPDMEGLSFESAAAYPERVLILLNFRMFAKDFIEFPKAISRDFLRSFMLPGSPRMIAADYTPTKEVFLSNALYDEMCDHWFLFRETQMAKTLWYYPSQKDFFQRLLQRVVKKNETQTEIAEAALRRKIASYYQAYLWDRQGIPFESLKRVLVWWASHHIPVTVVLTPQNEKFMGQYFDKPSFEKNRKTLGAFLKVYSKSGIHYEDWSKLYPSSFFLDHCHLKPEGNEQYAKDLSKLIAGGAK